MSTFYLSVPHYREIKNEILHGTPCFYMEGGTPCVRVECHEEAFFQFAAKKGWL